MKGSVVSATEAVKELPRLLTRLAAKEGPTYITDGTGRARAVLLDIDRYNAMMDVLEDGSGDAEAALAGALVQAILERSSWTRTSGRP